MDSNSDFQQLLRDGLGSLLKRRNLVFGLILLVALLGFEMFNYSTTEYALKDLLGNMAFAGVSWSTILALAFCGIDFAGVFRLFSTNDEEASTKEVWYLFGAWLLAATLNATLTWWGVSIALINHKMISSSVIDPGMVVKVVPIFVAIIVWVTRILLISSISSAGSRFLSSNEGSAQAVRQQISAPVYERPRSAARPVQPVRQVEPSQTQPSPQNEPRQPVPPPPPPAARRQPLSPPPASQPNRSGSRPRPTSRPPEPEQPPEPEYIPDPTYIPSPSFHSLSARNGNGNKSARQ